jgi:hypothetical protein
MRIGVDRNATGFFWEARVKTCRSSREISLLIEAGILKSSLPPPLALGIKENYEAQADRE